MDKIWYVCAVRGFSSMLSLATVSLSACSVAISSSTGATILQGPHHSAQKSTSTGLSLPKTSASKLLSVTVFADPIRLLLIDGLSDGGWVECIRCNSQGGVVCFPPGGVRGLLVTFEGSEVSLGVERRRATCAGSRDRLPVDVVDNVAGCEDAG